MRKSEKNKRELRSGWVGGSRAIGVGVVAGLLAVFSVVVFLVTFSVRRDIRSQMLDVDSRVLNLMVQKEIEAAERDAQILFEFEALSEVEVWSALLETATLDGVFAVLFFDGAGELVQSSSDSLLDVSLPVAVAETLEKGGVYSEFSEKVWLSEFVEIDFTLDRSVAVSDIYLRLGSPDGAVEYGSARYLMDGSSLANQFSVLDLRLLRQAALAIGIGGGVIVVIFWFAWRGLSEANLRVMRHAERLKKANTELAMLARTSAVGSVTAHLIHGLRNPLAGLREVVSAGRLGEIEIDEDEWKGASDAADRMQRMVEEVIAVLQDANAGLSFETTSGELFSELESRFTALTEEQGLVFSVSGEGGVVMESRVSGIALLVVSNLVQNAIDATARGGRVGVVFSSSGGFASIRVEDTGIGVSEELKSQLFSPVSSGKSGGAGIGLAISSQLAKHLNGSLEVLESELGATFELRFPLVENGVGGAG